jgi:hypothetical protein
MKNKWNQSFQFRIGILRNDFIESRKRIWQFNSCFIYICTPYTFSFIKIVIIYCQRLSLLHLMWLIYKISIEKNVSSVLFWSHTIQNTKNRCLEVFFCTKKWSLHLRRRAKSLGHMRSYIITSTYFINVRDTINVFSYSLFIH